MGRAPSRVVMLGTSFRTRGGIASVVESYRDAGLFERWPVDYVATHRDGTRLEKFLKVIDGVFVFLALACRIPRAVLHVHTASRASFWRKSFFMSVALLARWPVILHLHGGGFATFYEEECGPVRRAAVRFFLDRAATIVVVSDRWAAWMKRVTGNPRVVPIPNAVRLPLPARAKREPSLVVFAGRCSESKGIHDLLQAALTLRREIPKLRIECAGDGDLDELERSIASLGLADRVRVLGWVSPERRDELLARAGIFVLPSHAEGLPMAVLEAMAAGCPVIASAVGGIPDVIQDGVNGLLITAGDTRALAAAIRRLIDDPAFAARLGAAARATIAERFTIEPMVERLEQVYSALGVRGQTHFPGVAVNHPAVLVLGPHRDAISGVSTHVNLLMDSALGEDFELRHFQVGAEGRKSEGAAGRLVRLLASPFALVAAILFRRVALVHINTSLNLRAYWRDLAYLAVAKLLRARVIYQVHGGELPEQFFAGRRVLTAFLRWTLTLPDLVVVLASCELEAYRQFVPEQDVVAIPNGIDIRPFAHLPTVVSSMREPLRLIYIGRIAREKGLYETLQGMRLALELGVDARLTLAGAGAEEARLRRYAVAVGIAPRVTFAGPVFGDDKVNLMAGADVMLLPSYAEGLPYALLEAMAAGLPVIATPVGAIPDVVTHGTHGHLVPVRSGKAIAEALALMAGDRERIGWMSRACRRRVRAAYSIERVAREFAARYREVLGERVVAGAGAPAVRKPPSLAKRIAPMPAHAAGRKE